MLNFILLNYNDINGNIFIIILTTFTNLSSGCTPAIISAFKAMTKAIDR